MNSPISEHHSSHSASPSPPTMDQSPLQTKTDNPPPNMWIQQPNNPIDQRLTTTNPNPVTQSSHHHTSTASLSNTQCNQEIQQTDNSRITPVGDDNNIVNIITTNEMEINSHLPPSASAHNMPYQPNSPHNISSPSKFSNSISIPSKTNLPFGSILSPIKNAASFRFYFNNINSVRPYHDWTRWKSANSTLHQMNVDIYGAAENKS
jgi:hypothetical protein